MLSTGFLNKGKDHPGGNPEHWRQACEHGQRNACKTWARVLNAMCEDNDRDACLKVGGILEAGRFIPSDPARAGVTYGRACDLGSPQACSTLLRFVQAGGKDAFLRACDHGDGASCFVLGSLFSGGKGVPQDGAIAFDLFSKSCDLGWWRGCGRLGVSYLVGQGTEADPLKAVENFEKGCKGRNGASCFEVAKLYSQGTYDTRNPPLAGKRFRQACELGVQQACTWTESSVSLRK